MANEIKQWPHMITSATGSDVCRVFIERFTIPVAKFDIKNVKRPTNFESLISANENVCLSMETISCTASFDKSLSLINLGPAWTDVYNLAINKIVIM